MKTCTRCGEAKPVTAEFWAKNPILKGGLSNQCKVCITTMRRERRRREPEKRKAADDKRRLTDKHRKKHRDKMREKRKANPDAQRAYQRDYYNRKLKSDRIVLTEEQRRERARAALRKHWSENRDYYRARALAYMARKKGAEGTFSAEDVTRILADQRHQCFWCAEPLAPGKHHCDHFVPLSRGGSNWPENIVASCATCNIRKGSKMPAEFVAYMRSHGVPAKGPPSANPL